MVDVLIKPLDLARYKKCHVDVESNVGMMPLLNCFGKCRMVSNTNSEWTFGSAYNTIVPRGGVEVPSADWRHELLQLPEKPDFWQKNVSK